MSQKQIHIALESLGLSSLWQYFPTDRAKQFPEINRKITTLEYMRVVERVRKMDFALGFFQDKSSAKEEYVPKFDY